MAFKIKLIIEAQVNEDIYKGMIEDGFSAKEIRDEFIGILTNSINQDDNFEYIDFFKFKGKVQKIEAV